MKNKTNEVIETENRIIKVYEDTDNNIDQETVRSFGEEWTSFNKFATEEILLLGKEYFDIITSEMVNGNTVLADFGCGSGRFSKYWQGRVKKIYAVDPSNAVLAADKLLGKDANVEIVKASISNLPFGDSFFDFGMSIGVLHHIPNTALALRDCVKKVKIGGYFFLYLYYDLEDRGIAFKLLWKISNLMRKTISSLPPKIKKLACELIAVGIYLPFILLTKIVMKLNVKEQIWSKIPLSAYHNKSFFIMRNDALDRFGTPLEQRFSKSEIKYMMETSGLGSIKFSNTPPFWHAVGKRFN